MAPHTGAEPINFFDWDPAAAIQFELAGPYEFANGYAAQAEHIGGL
ncbi:hypothetical protein BURMUCF2_1834 [Burkholderia multivorans CF2]|nr:hypothetical protein BURMUCF2_1834 [Burkholderia multivorans CF2]